MQSIKASRRASVIFGKAPPAEDAPPPAYIDAKAPQPDASVLLTRKSASLFASLLEPPQKTPSQSHLARTFAPGATVHLLIFPNIKGEAPAKRWKSLTFRLVGTSEIRPYETLTTLHTVARVHKEVSVANAKDGGVPIAVSIVIPMETSCVCQGPVPLPSTSNHSEPGVTAAGSEGVGGGKSGGWMEVSYKIEISVARKGLMKNDELVSLPLTVYSPPFEDEVASISSAPSSRDWRTSTLVGPKVAAAMPSPYAPLLIESAQLEHYITELPKTLNISWRLSLKTAPQEVDDGEALAALLGESYFSMILARKLVPINNGVDEAAPAARVPLLTRRNLCDVLREPQPGQAWSPNGCPVNGVRLTGVSVVDKSEVPIVRSCNGGTQYHLIAHIECPGLVHSAGIQGGQAAALNVHKRLFVPKKGDDIKSPILGGKGGKRADGIVPLISRKRVD